MKRLRLNIRPQLWTDLLVAVTSVILIAGALWFTSNNMKKHRDILYCKSAGAEHVLNVSNNAFSSAKLSLKRCDTLKIVNSGAQDYELAFGVHQKHVDYPGFELQIIRPNEYIIVDAIQAGTYTMHDHIRDKASIQLDIRSAD